MQRFDCEGIAAVRPLGRGVFLTDLDEHVDEVISGLVDANSWGGRDVRLHIVVEAPELEHRDSQ